MDNKINYQLPDEVVSQVKEKLGEVSDLLKPFLLALSTDERIRLPKLGDASLPFVDKCLSYLEAEPQFAPPFLKVDQMTDDMSAYRQLMEVFRSVAQLYSNLDDTVMEAGAESYMNALSYYNSVKMAARMDIPGAKPIYEDLKQRFVKGAAPSAPAPVQPS